MSSAVVVVGRAVLAVVAVFGLSAVACGGQFNQVLNVGDAAPAWKDLPGTDGEKHSLSDLKDKKFVVVVFTCNSCPVARDYEGRIKQLVERRKDDVAVVAINVNRVPEDSPAKMKERAEKQRFTFPYLFDESQQIARDYGANGTPEFFVLSPDRKVVYMGSLDDDSDPAKAKVNYVDEAIAAALAGSQPKTTETFARGCRIRYVRKRG